MPFNGSGTYNPPSAPTFPVYDGTTILASQHNDAVTDIATALTNCVTRDGQSSASANLPMGGNKHTNVAAGTQRTEYARLAEVQDGAPQWLTGVAGADTITATGGLGVAAYVAGQAFHFLAAGTNTGPATLNINGVAAKNILKENGAALEAGDISIGSVVTVVYSGTAFYLQVLRPTLKAGGFKNKVLNGDFMVSQKGVSFVSPANLEYLLDGWQYLKSGAMTHTVTQEESGVPSVALAGRLAVNYMKFTLTAADTSIGASDVCAVRTHIEGYEVRDLFGGYFVATIIVYATTAGVYCLSFRNSGSTKSYVKEITINSANTWEKKTVVIPSPANDGSWNYKNSVGMQVTLALAAGSNFHTTADAWQSGSFLATSNQVNGVNTGSTEFRLSSVFVGAGSIDTPFETRPYEIELALCKRRFERISGDLEATEIGAGQSISTTSARTVLAYATKRIAPAITFGGTLANFFVTNSAGVQVNTTAQSAGQITRNSAICQWDVASGLVAGDATRARVTSGAYIDIDANL